ncbi:MAG: hypothetical protein J6L77_10425 [Coprococcus sp.]|nr:hypothetical protein [Coprococcus sp.]
MPVYKNCDICVSDFIEAPSLFQIHCTAIYDGQIVRGFCSKDLFQFEEKVRAEIRNVFDRLGDHQTDRTVKIWYQNPDDRKFDTNDIPLKIIITFYQPLNMDQATQAFLKEQLYTALKELLYIDWEEVNDSLKTYCTSAHSFVNTLNKISNPDFNETEMLASTKKVLKCLNRDMIFFYENQSFFKYSSVLANLETKYDKLDHSYLTELANEYARDTLF